MPGFDALEHYHPVPVLLAGLVTFASLLGIGVAVLARLRIALPGPWREVLAVLGSLLLLSLVVQVTAFAHLANPPTLRALGILLVIAGLPFFVRHARRARGRIPSLSGTALPLAIGGLAAVLGLLLAAAPSTKHDELHYHMLVPSRILADGGLVFHRQPWLAAIGPQMHFQIAVAPLHALGLPDAPNVVSWGFGVLLAGFVGAILYQRTRSLPWSVLCAAAIVASPYASVWHTTGGAHAMGDLATTAAVTALLLRRDLLREMSATVFAGLLSTLVVAAAASKVSFLPLGVLVLALGVFPALARGGTRLRIVGAAVLPWVLFYFPIAVWTQAQSGSPFGPLLRNVFAPSVYDGGIAREILRTRIGNQVGWEAALRMLVISVSPLIWIGMLAFFVLPGVGRDRRFVGGFLLGFQLLLTARLLPHDFRFLGGLLFALYLVAAVSAFPLLRRRLERGRVVGAVSVLALLPWLTGAGYRAAGMLPVSLGLQDPGRFCRRYVGFYEDFLRLDARLPDDAVLFTTFRLPSVYSPRPIYLDLEDLPPARPAYLLTIELDDVMFSGPEAINRRTGPVVYENAEAPVFKYRTPGRPPTTARLTVREIMAGR